MNKIFLITTLLLLSLCFMGCNSHEKLIEDHYSESTAILDQENYPQNPEQIALNNMNDQEKEEYLREKMMEQIKNDLLSSSKPISIEDARKIVAIDPIKPQYVPGRFKYYGLFIVDNIADPTDKFLRHVWYDNDKHEVLQVTLMRTNDSDHTDPITFSFSNIAENGDPISTYYPWANYVCEYSYIKSGIYVSASMLVENEDSKDECFKIVQSLQ